MTDYKTILFDLDGTLTDPIDGITGAVAYAINAFGDVAKTPHEYSDFIGPPLIDSFMALGYSREEGLELIQLYRVYFKDRGWQENKPYENIDKILTALKGSYQLAVATSKPTYFAEKILAHFKLDSYFDLIMGAELDGKRSAKADVIAEVIKQLELDYEETIMIGDRKHDLIGAKSHNLDAIGVLYGYGSLDELSNENPIKVIKRPDDLLKFFL